MGTELGRRGRKPIHFPQMGTGSHRTFLRLIPAPVFVFILAPDGAQFN